MSLYAIVMQTPKPGLADALEREALNHFKVHDGLIVVRSDKSAKALFDRLNISADERRGFVIFQITADYYGFASKSFWDWLASAFREDNGG